MSEKQHVLFFMAHHIIWDGWSFDRLYSELSALYAAFSSGMPSPLQALAVDYGDFAVWHCDWVRSDDFAKQLEFWRRRLDEIAVARELPTDMPRRTGMAGAGNTEWVVVDRNVTDSLHRLARNLDTTLFIVMMSLYGVLLHALSRQRQLVIGTPVRGRNSVELEAIMGFFNTLLPLPVQIDSGETFEALVARVKSITVESLKHPDVPLEQLTKELAAKRGNVGAELYQALFSFQDGRQRITNWGGLLHENILLFQRGATEDLGMWFVETKTGLHGGLTYNTDVFASGTVRILRDAYLLMIGRVTASSMLTIDEIVASLKVELPYLENRAIAHRDETHIAPIDRRLSPDADSLPTTETEKLLASIWSGLLKLSSVGRHDNFFDLGGGSLLAVQAIIAMEEKTGKRVDRSRFIFETLGQIAKSYDDVAQEPSKKSGGLRNLIAGMLASRKS